MSNVISNRFGQIFNRFIRRTIWNFLIGLLCAAWTGELRAEAHPIWNPGLEQAVTAPYARGRRPKSVEELRKTIGIYLKLPIDQLSRRISDLPGGASTEEGKRERAAAVYNLALLHHLSGDREAAIRSAVLLRTYSDVFPRWRYTVCNGKCGVWTGWYHADLDVSRNLALAFDLLAPTGILEQVEPGLTAAVRRLLKQIVSVDLEYPLYTINWAFLRPVGLVIYGRVLDDPELVHLGYWFLAKLIHELYASDGFIAEGSYSYHAQMTNVLLDPIQAYYLDGYSDPPGLQYDPIDSRWDTPRIDNYSLDRRHGLALARMKFSLLNTALPNGQWPVLNETKHYARKMAVPAARSMLLGGIGHAILAFGSRADQIQARLDFSPTISHHHRDALHLIYWALKKELAGGTSYHLPDRTWNQSSFSHNLVVVDRREQRGDYFVDWTESPYSPIKGRMARVARRTIDLAKANIHNSVVSWVPGVDGFGGVQWVEVDATTAYSPITSLYRRSLALVKVSETGAYLIDLFEVAGGSEYHWLLHGGHEEHDLEVDLQSTPHAGNLEKLTFERVAATDESWTARFKFPDGTNGVVEMLGRPNTLVIQATGPRYEFGGKQPHLIVERSAHRDDVERFIAVHHAHKGLPDVVDVKSVVQGSQARAVDVVTVNLRDGSRDFLVRARSAGRYQLSIPNSTKELTLVGRVAHVRIRGEQLMWLALLDGEEARFGGQVIKSNPGECATEGIIVGVERRESGFPDDALVATAPKPICDPGATGRSVYITLGNGWRRTYTAIGLRHNRLIVREEPGFEVRENGADLQYFPIQEALGKEIISGPIRFELSRSAVWAPGALSRSLDADPEGKEAN
jgi:hypothetical protein